MRKLQEIVRIVGRRRIKKIEVFNDGSGSTRESLYYKLYRGIRDGKFQSDTEAAQALFGTDPSDKKYLMLKSRVKKRLLNNLFFLEGNGSAYDQALYKCNRNVISSKFLLRNGAKESGVSLLKSTLNEARKYCFTEVELECLRMLKAQAAFFGRKTEFDQLSARFRTVQKALNAEYISEDYTQRLQLPFAKSSSPKPEMAEEAFGYKSHVETLLEESDTHNLLQNYYRIAVLAYSIAQDHRAAIAACNEAEAYLNNNLYLTTAIRLGEFALYRMVAYMHLGDYNEGQKMAETSLKYYKQGSNNWMIFLEYYFLLSMHTKNYEKAQEIYHAVVDHPRFVFIDEIREEKWRIFGAFLRYMIGSTASENSQEERQRRFNIWKFLNEVPIYSKDKRGLNIAILILQVLFLLDRKDYNGIISRTEALKVYASRYLKEDENYRSNLFLKMVLAMERKDFDSEQTMEVAGKYYKRLESSRFKYSGRLTDIEIIPYESLWQRILSKLK